MYNYIVAYVIEKQSKKRNTTIQVDMYRVFLWFDHKNPKKKAKKFYKKLLKSDEVRSANLCKVTKSTDY